MGAVAAGMANRPVQYLLTAVAHGYLDAWVNTRAIQGFDAFPDSVYRAGINASRFRLFARGIAVSNAG